jgi:hypothetical protein
MVPEMARLEQFFDLAIAVLDPDEEPPPGAHWLRIEDPPRREVERKVAEGWFYKPCFVTWVLEVPGSLEAYIEGSFRTGTRNKPRKLLRDVPRRYRLEADEGTRRIAEFTELYRRTIVARPRGKDRVAEHEDGFGAGWTGLYLSEGGRMVAGILVHEMARHLSVAYGGFDPEHRELDLEHYLIMQVIERAAGRQMPSVSLGMDTNRYGHHLPLGLPAYKLRIGFTPMAYEPAGRELARLSSFEPFEEGLFFFGYEGRGIAGHLFTRREPDLRPFAHHTAPPVRHHRIAASRA